MCRLFIALFSLASSLNALAAPTVEPLHESEVQYTCGCNFQFLKSKNTDETFLQWSEGEDALMRIDGKLEKLTITPAKSKSKKPGEISIGDEENYVLRNHSIQVNIYSTVTQVCAAKYTECESTGYRALITIQSPHGNTSVRAAGACGC